MAALYARGQLEIGEKFSHRSVIGTEFIGELPGTTTLGAFPAVLPTITGSGWVTGRSRWTLTRPVPRRLQRRRHLGPAASLTIDTAKGHATVSHYIDGKRCDALTGVSAKPWHRTIFADPGTSAVR